MTNPSISENFDRTHLKTNLKKRSIRGGGVTILSHGINFFIRTLSTIVLARLLVPTDFGIIAMVTSVTGFAGLFSDIGLSMATIQKDKINHEQVSTLFWVNVAAGALITLVTASLAPIIAWFYDEPRLTMITLAMVSTFFIGGLTIQHRALLNRQMRFIALASIQVLSLLVGVCVAIGSALAGAGYWALVLMQISSAFSSLIGLWIVCDWRPGRPMPYAGVRDMLFFGGNITLFNIVNYFARNFDNILIGRVWGAGSLGLYSKAYGLLMLPLRQINMPLSSVAIPALSALYGDLPRYQSYYLKTISLITLVSTPLVGFLIVCSDDLILLVLGPQWSAAGKIFAVLGISALIQPLYFTQGWLHVSAGRGDRYLRWGVISSILIVLSFIVGLPYGPVGVAIAYAAVTWAIIVPCMWYAGRSAGIELKFIFNAVSKNIASGLGSIAISYVLLDNYQFFETALGNLIVGFCIIFLTYIVLILLIYRDLSVFHQVFNVARVIFPGSNRKTVDED